MSSSTQTPDTASGRTSETSPTPASVALSRAKLTTSVEGLSDTTSTPLPGPGRVVKPTTMTGAQAIVRTLEELGVDSVFGLPGGAILPTYDALMDAQTFNHILVRHEQGAGHAAEGYAAATGKVGVCIATSGPGATNLVTALADAHMDSIPIVAITGQVNSSLIGTDGFQEADIVGMTIPVTKHNFLVTDPHKIVSTLAAAFHLAGTGRPGPVLVDISKDAQQAQVEFSWPPEVDLPGYHVSTKPHSKQIRQAAKLINDAETPVFYVGGGVLKANAAAELLALAELTNIPVVTTLMAKGAFPDSHPQHVGMPGMHGSISAVAAIQDSDLLISLGARFDDRVTGDLSTFAPKAKVIHADIDPAEISKNRVADVPIVGDAKAVISQLIEEIRDVQKTEPQANLTAWWEQLNKIREEYPLGYGEPQDGSVAPQRVIERIGQLTGPDAVYVAGVGQHQMWAAQFISYENPRTWLNSGGLGTMGYSIPAAMGAKVGEPDKVVWAIDGDGCFQMTNQELATCLINDIPIKVAIINNSSLGMVKQWQTLHYNERYSHSELYTGKNGAETSPRIPDFVKLAEAYGCVGLRCERTEDIDATIQKALEINDRPVVVDFVVSSEAMVWPMVPPGAGLSAIQFVRGISPKWDNEE